eukprot:945997-Rhodomonas_salina.2
MLERFSGVLWERGVWTERAGQEELVEVQERCAEAEGRADMLGQVPLLARARTPTPTPTPTFTHAFMLVLVFMHTHTHIHTHVHTHVTHTFTHTFMLILMLKRMPVLTHIHTSTHTHAVRQPTRWPPPPHRFSSTHTPSHPHAHFLLSSFCSEMGCVGMDRSCGRASGGRQRRGSGRGGRGGRWRGWRQARLC